MPITDARSGSRATACSARPQAVRLRNSSKAITSASAITKIARYWADRRTPPMDTKSRAENRNDGKASACEPKNFATKPCRKMPTPSVVTTQPMLPPTRAIGRIAIDSVSAATTPTSTMPPSSPT